MSGLSQSVGKMLSGQGVSALDLLVGLAVFAVLAVLGKFIAEFFYGKRPIKTRERTVRSLESALLEAMCQRDEAKAQAEVHRSLLNEAIEQRNELDWANLMHKMRIIELEKSIESFDVANSEKR